MSLLATLYHMETSEMITIKCPMCSGRRYIASLICAACNGEGVTYVRRRDPRKVALRRVGMTLVVIAGFLGAYLVFTS